MNEHRYQLMPDLSTEEYAALKEDIRRSGVLVPIEKDDQGNILDGHNRDRIWQELKDEGLKMPDPPVIIRPGLSEDEKRAHVRSLNLNRRHLSQKQRRQLIADQLKETPERSNRQVAEMLSVDDKTVGSVRRELERRAEFPHVETRTDTLGRRQPAYRPSIIAKTEREEREILAALPDISDGVLPDRPVSSWSVVQVAKRERVRARLQDQVVDGGVGGGITTGDFREAGSGTTDGSVNLIFTDPPYDRSSVGLYGDLAAFAARVLRPGGLCLAYVGVLYLDEVMALMRDQLEYLWTFAITHSGGGPVMRIRHVRNLWKPILAFAKPPIEAWWEIVPDLISGGKEKDSHKWQQALGEAEHFIKHLCPEGGVVCDPFAGSGTSLVAAAKLGRRYVGFEIDPETAAGARARIASAVTPVETGLGSIAG